MMQPKSLSIIICTCNRAKHLRGTLMSLAGVCVPMGLPTELLVVDNGSTDDTAEVVKSCRLPNVAVRYIYEARRGKGYAYNRAMAEAAGAVFLFTDDDVRFPENWITGMCEPILQGKADAVAGGVRFAPHLMRDWMTLDHRSSLASTERLNRDAPEEMVGANMAFARHVLEQVPEFDVNLGPGALGFGDDTLFTFQLKQAGYRVVAALDVSVEHHFDPSRLTRKSHLQAAEKFGRTRAYLAYHWQHEKASNPRLYLVKRSLRLIYWRIRRRSQNAAAEGIPLWEKNILMDIYFYKQYLQEQTKARLYDRNGLVKREYA